MSKLRIFRYHLWIFLLGSIGLVSYVFIKINALKGGASLGGTIALPAIVVVYIVGLAFLCLISFGISVFVAYLRKKRRG